MASLTTRNRILVGVGGLAFVGMLAWALSMPNLGGKPAATADVPANAVQEPTTATASAPKSAAQPSVTAKLPVAPATPPPDLFADPMPEFMSKLRDRAVDKKWLDASEEKQLYTWGKEHPNDARPQLILAWESMNRDWKGIAVRMYRMAYRADHRAKDDPSMLRDLLGVASEFDTEEYREASAVIREAYGEGALPKIDDAIAELRSAGSDTRADRLQKLRGEVSSRE